MLKLTTKLESAITPSDVVKCAYLFSSLACAVNRLNNALKKTKSVSSKIHGLTNNALDTLAFAGIFETSRTYRNDRDFLAAISEHILNSYAKISVPQLTFDNMDMCIGQVMHHMTLPFLEFEKEDTKHLSMEDRSKDEVLGAFKIDTVLLTSDINKKMFAHYKYVTAWTLGRILAEHVEEVAWMKKVFPKHYTHPNSATSSKKSSIFVQKPLNYSENKNSDMIKIMDSIQYQYLNFVGQQSENPVEYFENLKLIYSSEVTQKIREKAEEKIKLEVKKAGELICHGDLLTDVRFESCKRLKRMGVSAVERHDFLKIFRLGTFHLEMNKGYLLKESGLGQLEYNMVNPKFYDLNSF